MSCHKFSFLAFFLCVSLSSFSSADTKNQMIRAQCNNEAATIELIKNNNLGLKPDEFQAAALRNQGIDPEVYHEDLIRNVCDTEVGTSISYKIPPGTEAFLGRNDRTIISFPDFRCTASWDEECKETRTYRAPTGFQACFLSYRFRTVGKNVKNTRVTPVAFFNGDPEDPDRFRSYEIFSNPVGNGRLGSGKKVKVIYEDIKLYAISAEAKNKTRFEVGCDVPIDGNDGLSDIIIPDIPEIEDVE